MDQKPGIHFVNAATTVSGPAAAASVTLSPSLKLKTTIGVIVHEGGETILSLYRLSSLATGQYSRDIYRWKGWKLHKKDKVKYAQPPFAPAGAFREQRGDLEIWSMEKMTEEEIKNIEKLMKPSTKARSSLSR
jgi:hypothetical protein